jgi:5-methylcytosine-specific restriction endonuclease McrA
MRQPRSVYDARWKAKHPEYKSPQYPEKAKENYLKNRDKYLLAANERYKNMTNEERIEHNRKRRERHARQPHVRNIVERQRDHAKRAQGVFNPVIWEIVKGKYSNKCIYCGSGDNITIEHRLPVSKGGDNSFYNLAPACLSCNSSKRQKTEDEYREWCERNGKILSSPLEIHYSWLV